MPEQTDRLAEIQDLSPTELAIATMRARRDTATCPLTGDEWLLLAEIERLQQENADYEQALAIPGEDAA